MTRKLPLGDEKEEVGVDLSDLQAQITGALRSFSQQIDQRSNESE